MLLQAVMRTDEHHQLKHPSILKLIEDDQAEFKKTGQHTIQTLFFGDSITRRWEDNIELWNAYFAPFKPANFGVGADTLGNILWRMQNGELEKISPERMVFMGGTNSLKDESVGDIIDTIEEMVRIINRKLPQTKLLLLGIQPRNNDEDGFNYNARIVQVNAALKAAVEAGCFERTQFADLGPLLLAPDGKLRPQLTPDGLHLNAEGYKVTGPEIARLLAQL
ncbi:MAG: hypothetical protein K6G18_16105 [Treponema sp.]|nr:hypothetical protein [Treponema sp.]